MGHALLIAVAAMILNIAAFTGSQAQTNIPPLNPKDQKEYKTAFEAAAKKKWKAAFRHGKRASNKLPLKALEWQYYLARDTDASFVEITSFIDRHPDWPLLGSLQVNAEQRITDKTPRKLLLGWFTNNPPKSARGMLHYAHALIQMGRIEDAKALVRRSWVAMDFSVIDEKTLRARHRKWLTKQDNLDRLERLIWEGKTHAALRQARYVDKGHRLLAQARVVLRRRGYGVDRAIRDVPKDLKNHPGLVYERLRWRVRKGRYGDATNLALSTRADQSKYANLWWRQRAILARWALREGRISDAYRLAAEHQATEGFALADAEWTAGWVSLRFLRDPQQALAHFKKMHANVSYPVSLARGAYWVGLTLEELNKPAEARLWFEKAAKFQTRFYGQMAANHLPYDARQPVPAEYEPNGLELQDFHGKELVRLIHHLDQAKADDMVKRMIRHMAQTVEDEASFAMLGQLAHQIERPDLAVYTARQASKKHIQLLTTGYPSLDFKNKDGLDPAVVLAVVRQESGFDIKALSHAGARGLMQLMPATAKQVARSNRLKYSKSKLTSDGAYNLTLGQSYLSSLTDRFDGSLPMAFAGYNAGPHRVKRWIREFGDPRKSAEEAIDWIETIPFEETRNYVQRVLENVIVYRQRAEGRHIALSWAVINGDMSIPSN